MLSLSKEVFWGDPVAPLMPAASVQCFLFRKDTW